MAKKSTTVFNLDTYDERVYTLAPREAVIAAYAQSKGDWNTWDYEKNYGHLVSVRPRGRAAAEKRGSRTWSIEPFAVLERLAKKNPKAPRLATATGNQRKKTMTQLESNRRAGKKKWMQKAIKREGKLGGPGYLSRPAAERHKILNRCVRQYGYRSCLGSVMILNRSTAIRRRYGTKVTADKNYLVRTFGGPGSFTRRRNPETTSWDLVPEIAMELFVTDAGALAQNPDGLELTADECGQIELATNPCTCDEGPAYDHNAGWEDDEMEGNPPPWYAEREREPRPKSKPKPKKNPQATPKPKPNASAVMRAFMKL